MITQLNDLPAYVVGFCATGIVTKEDYETILIPAVDDVAKKVSKINFLFVLDTCIANMETGAWLKDVAVGLKHFTNWRKMAIVTNQTGVNKVTAILAHIMPCEVRAYTIPELEAAKEWIAV